ncbi:MAG: Crp/Fnr family transcriptional regulator [Sphingorhabdus sp.]
MSGPVQSVIKNKLLAAMAPADFALVAPDLVHFELPRGHILSMPGRPIQHCWFFEDGIASMVAASRNGHETEAGIVGNDGIVDIATSLGVDDTCLRCFMQIPGHGYRMSARALATAMEQSTSLRSQLNNFVYVTIAQIAQTALANASLTVEERLARWLLMCADRVASDEIKMTHEFLSVMLNVRRAGVTLAMQSLQRAGYVEATRGKIRIVDRFRLERFASDAYTPLG